MTVTSPVAATAALLSGMILVSFYLWDPTFFR